ncbi:actin family protein [Haliangium ochraceum]|uniref:Bacterial actin-related protein n=1 Tax=Haliangium ochraceum (strain DSM 14365 / JCM 11303 / SMP-2) TaxID=502025 RepID=BARP_HALO1|nr:actin family protein [Haliangium ochraceum]D0LWX4.1 RecName: Full=Bacterial actin-related protein; Short=BARP [Haliangium ochraceum DSM 14365]ACY14221.1 actin/actin family protein [Haliangium ochraceum DSM 14365]
MSDSYVFSSPIIIHPGSDTLQAGLADEEHPGSIFPNIVGRHKLAGLMEWVDQRVLCVGQEAIDQSATVLLRHPVWSGIVGDWEAFAAVLRHTFYRALWVAPEEHPIVVTESPHVYRSFQLRREQLTRLLFETFHAPQVAVCSEAAMSLYACGLDTGLVVSLGDFVSYVAPVHRGAIVDAGLTFLEPDGRSITEYLSRLLLERGHVFTSPEALRLVRDIKETLCYVADDVAKEAARNADSVEATYLLPNGETLVLGNERFRCPEVLFHPDLLGWESPGLTDAVCNAIMKCDPSLQAELFGNIVVTGGGSLFPGLSERLQRELEQRAPAEAPVHLLTRDDRRHLPWKGAARFARDAQFAGFALTRQAYERHGAELIYQM